MRHDVHLVRVRVRIGVRVGVRVRVRVRARVRARVRVRVRARVRVRGVRVRHDVHRQRLDQLLGRADDLDDVLLAVEQPLAEEATATDELVPGEGSGPG